MTCAGCGGESGGAFCPSCGALMPVETAREAGAEVASEATSPVAVEGAPQAVPEGVALADAGGTGSAVQVLEREAVATAQESAPPEVAERLASLWSTRTLPERAVAVAVAAVLVILAVVGIATQVGGGSPEQAAVPPKSAAATKHEICVRQLMAMGANMYLNSHFDHEVAVNGPKDPFLPYARKVGEVYTGVQGSDGADTGASRAQGMADGYCKGPLKDAVRAHYPTDGSYPKQ